MINRWTYLFLVLITTTVCFGQSLWQLDTLAPMPLQTSNNSVVEGFINGEAYVYSFAGIDATKLYSGIHLRSFRLDVLANTWEELAPLPDPMGGKIACSASRIGDIIYIIGGYHVAANGSEISSAKVHRFDIVNNTFLTDGADVPVPIDDQSQVVIGKDIYIISGWSNVGNRTEVQVYDTEANVWQQANKLPNTNAYKVFGSAGAVIGDTLYYYGGAGGGGFGASQVFRKGVLSSVDQIDWTENVLSEFSYRPAASTVIINGEERAIWIGGSDVSYNFNGIAYNGSGGVAPSNRIMMYSPALPNQVEYFSLDLPMDLRSVASIDEQTKIIAGGMEAGQVVTNQTLRLSYTGVSNIKEPKPARLDIVITPNPAHQYIKINAGPDWVRFQNETLRIFNIQGELVKTVNLTKQMINFAIGDLESGFYILKIRDQTQQFIVE